ncbi:MAG: TRAP transporter permease [Alphaproteobacteria bacterium]
MTATPHAGVAEAPQEGPTGPIRVEGVDVEPLAANQREPTRWQAPLIRWATIAYTVFHLLALNVYPLETWTFRALHVLGALIIGFLLFAAARLDRDRPARPMDPVERVVLAIGAAGIGWGLGCVAIAFGYRIMAEMPLPPEWVLAWYGWPLAIGTAVAIAASWAFRGTADRAHWADWLLIAAALASSGYLLFNLDADNLRMRAGTPFAAEGNMFAAVVGIALILELTRRVAGLPLVVISGVFVAYSFLGPWLPGFLTHRGYEFNRFFTYLYTTNGILGPTTAVSSTYIILFIIFAAFLQVSRVGEYFVNFAFATAGRARGGPAKVAVFASGLMGMINGTSAGNVAATGSLTIPMMKRVGYRAQSAGAIEAAASTGGQIMPPIMGAGAFIMAEITGIPYPELVIAAIIPAALYFLSVYFMVDFEARRMGMRGMARADLPSFRGLALQIYKFVPIVILIVTLYLGFSVIRAGTLALLASMLVCSPRRFVIYYAGLAALIAGLWIAERLGLSLSSEVEGAAPAWLALTDLFNLVLLVLLVVAALGMGWQRVLKALEISAKMAIQIIAVCAAAGVIVGVIALTGIGSRFSNVLLGLAEASQLLAMIFAMVITIILGMGMPTTAAYAIGASVIAPGLQQLGIQPLVAHFFVFYFAVISAITPPVALAAYTAAGISGADPMRTSVTAFKFGLAAFIVPFCFFYNPALLMAGEAVDVIHVTVTACIGVYLLSAAVQGWLFGPLALPPRVLALAGALAMIEGGWLTDLVGLGLAAVAVAWQKLAGRGRPKPEAAASEGSPGAG